MKFDDCCCCLPTEPVIAYNSRTRVFHGDKLIYIYIYIYINGHDRSHNPLLARGNNAACSSKCAAVCAILFYLVCMVASCKKQKKNENKQLVGYPNSNHKQLIQQKQRVQKSILLWPRIILLDGRLKTSRTHTFYKAS